MDPKSRQYQVIARKYRPQKFSDVVGQEAIVTTLKNALRWDRLAHAYLFCGCRGTGKTTLARLFAKALNCERRTDAFEPCNECPSCLDIIASRSLDVLEIDGASNRGIDDIRQINETIGYAPASGRYKIYIIDEVHMLTKEAFNALLKTLEEPPPNVKFFFATTEPHKVLPTILSRCQRFDLGRIPLELLVKKLAAIAEDLKIPCEEEVFSLIAQLAEGSLRDAESLLDQILCYGEPPLTASKVAAILGILPQASLFAFDRAFSEQNFSYAFELADEIFSSGKEISHFLDTLLEHYRRYLRHKLKVPTTFYTPKEKEQFLTSSDLYTQEQCLYILDYLIQWQQQLSKIPFKRITLEMILLHILHTKYRVTLPSLVKRLNELQSGTAPECALPLQKPTPPIETIELPKEPEPAVPEPILEESLPPIETIELPKEPEPVAPEPMVEETSIEEALLKKMREKLETHPLPLPEPIPEPLPAPVVQEETRVIADTTLHTQTPSAPAPDDAKLHVRYETLMRFAAVELEGVLKKETPNG